MNKTKTHVNAPIPSNRTILTFLSVISLFISNYINGVIHLIFLCASWGSASRHYRHSPDRECTSKMAKFHIILRFMIIFIYLFIYHK